jgi:hypothetical protein
MRLESVKSPNPFLDDVFSARMQDNPHRLLDVE